MDRIRFGRVLGRGARLAARTAIEAVDAATASPTATGTPATAVRSVAPASRAPLLPPKQSSAEPIRRGRLPPVPLSANFMPAARAAGQGMLAPVRQASRALWHELTGSFFALFALSFGVGVWHTRADAWSGVPVERHRFIAFCLMTLLFAYFSVSSFARARKRD